MRIFTCASYSARQFNRYFQSAATKKMEEDEKRRQELAEEERLRQEKRDANG